MRKLQEQEMCQCCRKEAQNLGPHFALEGERKYDGDVFQCNTCKVVFIQFFSGKQETLRELSFV